jgi:hypothetical protein
VFLFQVTPFVVQSVGKPTRETSVYDILIGSVGLIGAILIGALLFGILLGVLLVTVRILRDKFGSPDGHGGGTSLHLSSLTPDA